MVAYFPKTARPIVFHSLLIMDFDYTVYLYTAALAISQLIAKLFYSVFIHTKVLFAQGTN